MRPPSRRPGGPAVLAVALAAGALPAPAVAAPAVVPPVPFATASSTNTLDLTPLPDGRVALAWTHAVTRSGVGFALRPAGGLFSAGTVQDVTGESHVVLGPVPPAGGAPYRLVRTRDGGAIAHALTGSSLDGGAPRNFAFNRQQGFSACPDGGWVLAGETATTAGGRSLFAQRISATGVTSATLGNLTGTHDSAEDPGDGVFPFLRLSCTAGELLLGLNRDTDTGAGETEVLTVRRFTGTTSTERLRLTAPAGVDHGQYLLAEQPDGRVWVAYETFTDSGPGPYGVSIASAVPGDPLQTTALTSIPGADLRDLAVDGAGRLLVLYDAHPPGSTDNDDPGIPTVATVEPGATTLVTTALAATADDRSRSFLRGHPDGRPRLVTTFSDSLVPPADDRVVVSGMPGIPGQAGDPPLVVRAADGGFFRGAYLPGGDLVAAWHDLGTAIVEGGIDAGTPPTLGDVQAPGAVVAGEPVDLATAPSDPMGLSASGWVVDDATLSGARVQTTFATAGTRVVTAFAVDRAGNRTETTRTIRVLPADAVAPVPAAPVAQPPAADRRAPRITTLAQTPSRLSRRATVLRVRVRVDEASAVDLELRGRVRRGGARATLVLSTARVARLAAGSTRTVRLRVPAALVRLVEGGRLDVRAIATDAVGNRGTRTVRVRRR